jgi:hypothetical protein
MARDYENILEDDKSKMSVDEILSYFLYVHSRKVNQDYYLVLLKFVIGFRECLNKYGWEKKAENDEHLMQKYSEKWQTDPPVVIPPPDDVANKAKELRAKAGGLDYSTINCAEHAPEICNEFVTIFVQDRRSLTVEKNQSIDLTRNLCHWLFQESFTTSKVTMIK